MLSGPTGAASAANGDGTCDNNEICVYKNATYVAPRSDFLYAYSNMDGGVIFHTYNYPSYCNTGTAAQLISCRLNDSITSAHNRSDHRSVRLFTNANYDGNFQTVHILTAPSVVTYNDQISSECWNDAGVSLGTDVDCTFSN